MARIHRTLFKIVMVLVTAFFALRGIFNRYVRRNRRKKTKIGFLNIEYFDQSVGGFGGYGMCAKNITDRCHTNGSALDVEMLITRPRRALQTTRIHNTDVVIVPDPQRADIIGSLQCARLLNAKKIDLILTMEYYPAYLPSILSLPAAPVIIWIHDPRPADEIEKIATVSLEVLASGEDELEDLKRHAQYKEDSIKKILALSHLCNRKVFFATTAYSLIELAKRTYGLPDIKPFLLPTPVEVPHLETITASPKPSVCFLGRLDPIKRPWIFFELAKQFPSVDFLVAGITHVPHIMQPLIDRYVDLPNLKFLGLLVDEKKDELLRNVWALINTSVHEALPVSFLESFSYGKPVISCQNPDQLVERFGAYTGERLGDGFDAKTIHAFAEALGIMLSNTPERLRKGEAARRFVREQYSFQQFENALLSVLGPREPEKLSPYVGNGRVSRNGT